MRGQQDIKDALTQNLQDAGCDNETIKEFFELLSKNEMDKIFKLLAKYRETLLKTLHDNQKEIDILDYLILDLRKNNYSKSNYGGK